MSATSLPPLPPVGGHITQKVMQSMASYQTKTSHQYSGLKSKRQASGGKVFSGQSSAPPANRNQKPSEIIDTARFRNSIFHNLCVDMLKDGYHQAFQELFQLVQQDKARSAELELASNMSPVLLEDEEGKLEFMRDQLTAAELARRNGQSEKVYQSYLTLARHFQEINDFWLSDYFFEASYTCTSEIRGDGRCREAEANWNLGLVCERQSNFLNAQKYFEEFYSLTEDKEWKSADGVLFHSASCACLKRCYIALSQHLPTEDKEEVLKFLHKAYDMGKEGGDAKELGNVSYSLGQKYDFYGDQDTAVTYYNEYLEMCEAQNDDLGIGRACQALATARERSGDIDGAVEDLKKFLRVSERANDIESMQAACSDLGSVFNSMGKYEQASKYLRRAFEASVEGNNLDEIDGARCEYALSLSHGLLTGCVEAFMKTNRTRLESLTLWKSERVQGFSKDQTTYDMYEPLEVRLAAQEEKADAERKALQQSRDSARASLESRPSQIDEQTSQSPDQETVVEEEAES